jgi:hypothetical protein
MAPVTMLYEPQKQNKKVQGETCTYRLNVQLGLPDRIRSQSFKKISQCTAAKIGFFIF